MQHKIVNNFAFTKLNIKDLYPSITEPILDRPFSLAKENKEITMDQLKIIKDYQRSLLFDKETEKFWKETERKKGCNNGKL